METTLFRVQFTNGSEYRVYCANKSQKDRFFKAFKSSETFDNVKVTEVINGIHTVKQWEQITNNL